MYKNVKYNFNIYALCLTFMLYALAILRESIEKIFAHKDEFAKRFFKYWTEWQATRKEQVISKYTVKPWPTQWLTIEEHL